MNVNKTKSTSEVQCRGLYEVPGSGLIIEPRKHPALKLVISNALEKLPTNWEIVVVHGTNNGVWMREVLSNLPEYDKRIRLHQIPHINLNIREYSRVMTSTMIWNLPKYENVLVFQTDSFILDKSPHKLKDFMSYSFVGAPWPCIRHQDKIGNGGFSFRKKSACLDAIKNCKFNRHPEDYFFIRYFNRHKKYKVSPFHIARAFSVERIFYETPFGIHKCWEYLTPSQWNGMVNITPFLKQLKILQMVHGPVPRHVRYLRTRFIQFPPRDPSRVRVRGPHKKPPAKNRAHLQKQKK